MTRSLEPELERAQADFERRLFESARSDASPAGETERAWLRFAARAGALVPLAVAASAPPLCWRSARASALKWGLLGAIGGGSLVAVWLRAPLSERVPPGSGVVASVAVAPVAVPVVAVAAPVAAAVPAVRAPAVGSAAAVAAQPAPGVVAGRAAAAAAVATPAAAAARPAAAVQRPQRKPLLSAKPGAASRRASSRSLAEASLAREVAALDAARSALALGASASALRQIEQYHRDFPAGELSADADVVAIEALVADGDRAAARRAAQQFLERRPHDPHGARVRELAR